MKNERAKKFGRAGAAALLSFTGGAWGSYAAAFVFMLIGRAGAFMLPQIVSFAADSVLAVADNSSSGFAPISRALAGAEPGLGFCAAALVVTAAIGGLFDCLCGRALAGAAEGISRRLRERLFAHILSLPYSWHLSIKTGDIIQRCTSDLEIVRSFFHVHLMELARVTTIMIFAYSVLFATNAPTAAASAVFVPVIAAGSICFMLATAHRYLEADEAEGELLSIAQENFTGVRVVRAFGQERAEAAKFSAQNESFAGIWIRLGDLLSTYWGLGDLFVGLQMIATCAVGAWQASLGELSVGGFFVFINYNAMIIWPVRGLGRVLSESGKAAISAGRIAEILAAEPERDAPGAIEAGVDDLRGDIEFDNVTFGYGGEPVLRGVTFRARGGRTLGILGATGSGKSTVAHLLCRMYDLGTGEGSIKIGGRDIREFTRASLRRGMGIVLQEPFLYSRTIAENIASLAPSPDMEAVREAAEAASVAGDIERFDAGYGTLVGERGVTLSGGQKQRVAIARALMKRAPIMILDDSLSAVDTETDAKIRSALVSRSEGITAVIIAHRVTSVAGADHILIMEGGRVAEQGPPRELLERGGMFRRLFDAQNEGAAREAGAL